MNKKILIVIVLVIVLMGTGVFTSCSIFGGKDEDANAPVTLTYFETGEYLVTNLRDETQTLVKLTVVLGVDEENADLEFLTASNAVIRDRIVYVMRGHYKADFADNSSMNALSEEICQAINTELGVDYVKRAYFFDFVIQ